MSDPNYLPDGVYLRLPEEQYFAQDCIGSSDLITLYKRKSGWWWQSRHNPDRVERVTKEKTYGSATHAIVLEGVEAYEQRFIIAPEKPANALVTIGDVQAALTKEGFSLRNTSGWRAPQWWEAAEVNLPRYPCWPNMQAEFERQMRETGRQSISAIEDRMLRVMVGAILEDPQLRLLFGIDSPVPPLAEVSIFKTLPDGTRRRWRLDRIFPKFSLDLKTLGAAAAFGRPLEYATGDHIGRGGYDIQRADYDAGRATLNAYVQDGFQVFGGSLDERTWLKRLVEMSAMEGVAPRESFDWVWLFYQKPDPKGFAPIVFPVYDNARSDLWVAGKRKARRAMNTYREYRARFGLERPWTHVADVHYTDPDLDPHITLPHWIGEEDPGEEAAYAVEGEKTA